ncbi:hypothetical protein LCGC14_2210560 [marine sediment metagenome]|uniref:Uncharacterized protein n=1 Tax=marine sediment metagenome TaxID=412755 RepID=A0A0F9G9M1_9ZZZZ
MYMFEMVKKRYKKNGILLGSDGRWLLRYFEKLLEVNEFYANVANWLPIQYGMIVETEAERDGGMKAKELLDEIEKED